MDSRAVNVDAADVSHILRTTQDRQERRCPVSWDSNARQVPIAPLGPIDIAGPIQDAHSRPEHGDLG